MSLPIKKGESVGEVFRRELKARNYSRNSIRTYVGCMARLCQWSGVAPLKIESQHVSDYLSTLANTNRVVNTQKQVLCAAARFFELILRRPMGDLNFRSGSTWRRIPIVLSRGEVSAILDQLDGRKHLRVALMYGCGLRKSELLRLRVHDIDFERGRLIVRDGKGGKDREVALPESLVADLFDQVGRVARLHAHDLARGLGWVDMPGALAVKWPKAEYQLGWQWLWPARGLSKHPETGRVGRWHYCPKALTRDVNRAVGDTSIQKHVKCHTFRHSFATHQVEDGCPIHVLKDILGHKSIETTEIYLHTAASRLDAAGSPLDRLAASNVVPFQAAAVLQPRNLTACSR